MQAGYILYCNTSLLTISRSCQRERREISCWHLSGPSGSLILSLRINKFSFGFAISRRSHFSLSGVPLFFTFARHLLSWQAQLVFGPRLWPLSHAEKANKYTTRGKSSLRAKLFHYFCFIAFRAQQMRNLFIHCRPHRVAEEHFTCMASAEKKSCWLGMQPRGWLLVCSASDGDAMQPECVCGCGQTAGGWRFWLNKSQITLRFFLPTERKRACSFIIKCWCFFHS
jgi:hypothetical protein